MGVSHIWYDPNIRISHQTWQNWREITTHDIDTQLDILDDLCTQLRYGLDQCFQLVSYQRWDLGRDNRDPWLWAGPLARKMTEFVQTPGPEESVTMVYEFQMNANNISRSIGNMLVYHFALACPQATIYRIQPALKNKICIGGVAHYDFLKAKSSNYGANKAHSVALFLKLLQLLGMPAPQDKKLDDIADSVIQALAYIRVLKNGAR